MNISNDFLRKAFDLDLSGLEIRNIISGKKMHIYYLPKAFPLNLFDCIRKFAISISSNELI